VRENIFKSALEFGATQRPHLTPTGISPNPRAISVRTVFEQHLTLQVGDRDPSINTDEGIHEKPKVSGLDEDVEGGV
jgi:hypothetical protein